jgi:hypothetical protein
VYKSLVPRREVPHASSTSFFQEKLVEWRELNAAHDWLECYKEVQPLCSTLPQLVHHQERILDSLLSRVRMECVLSLEPLMDLLVHLSRDLASDFLTHLERVLMALSAVIVECCSGWSGCSGHKGAVNAGDGAVVLEAAFSSLSGICKNLASYLVLDLKPVLKLTSGLRRHRLVNVRRLAGETLGYLVRRAKDPGAAEAIRYLFAESGDMFVGDTQEGSVLCQGNGEVLAGAVRGVGHGLHSRCGRLLRMVFDDGEDDREYETLGGGDDEATTQRHGEAASQHRAAVYLTRHAFLVSCFEYVRDSEALDPFWDAVLTNCRDEMRGSFPSKVEMARMAILLRVLVGHRGGSRVVAHVDSVFDILGGFFVHLRQFKEDDGLSSGSTVLRNHGTGASVTVDANMYLNPILLASVLDLASGFLSVLSRRRLYSGERFGYRIEAWRPAFLAMDIETYVGFVESLVRGTGNGVGQIFQSCPALGSSGPLTGALVPLAFDKISEELSVDAERAFAWEKALSLSNLAQWASPKSKEILSRSAHRALDSESSDIVLLALKSTPKMFETMQDVDEFVSKALVRAEHAGKHRVALMSEAHAFKVDAASHLAESGISIRTIDMSTQAKALMMLLEDHPTDRHVVGAAAKFVAAFPNSIDISSTDRLVNLVSQNLSNSSSRLRIDVLTLSVALGGGGGATVALSHLLDLETHPLGADSGRHATVVLSRIQNLIEYKKIPKKNVLPCVRGLLGLLHFKLSSYWGPTVKSLAAAIEAFPEISWPEIIQSLVEVESELQTEKDRTEKEISAGLEAEDDSSEDEGRGEDLAEGSHDENSSSPFREYEEAEDHPSSDGAARLSHHLKALALVSVGVLTNRSKDWVPIFLRFCSDDVRYSLSLSLKRSILREWLKVLQNLKRKVKKIHQSDEVLKSLCLRIMDIDPLVQSTVLHTLKLFDLEWLNPYLDPLLRFVDNKTLRSELASFQLQRGADFVQIEHRQELVPFLIATLFPKIRKRNGRLGGKGAPGSARAAILNFLSAAEPSELGALLELFLLPMAGCFRCNPDQVSMPPRLYLPVLTSSLPQLDDSSRDWMDLIDPRSLAAQPAHRHIGYLNAIDDVTKHLGFKIVDYLPMISALIVKMLALAIDNDDKQVRIKCLRLFSAILSSFGSHVPLKVLEALLEFVDTFIPLIAVECNAERPPALVELSASILTLMRVPGKLLGGALEALSAPHCSEGCRAAILDMIETIIDDHGEGSLVNHADTLLSGLDCTLAGFRKHRALAVRSLNILEVLSSSPFFLYNEKITKALISMLVVPKRKWQRDDRRRLSEGNEVLLSRACACLAAIWNKASESGHLTRSSEQVSIMRSLAPLVLMLNTQDARENLCLALLSFHACGSTKLLKDLNSFALTEPDYDKRLEAYRNLWVTEHSPDGYMDDSPTDFSNFLIYQCCVDLANPTDLSLRHAASSALRRFLGDTSNEALVKNILMPEIRLRIAGTSSQTVRQEHLEIIRQVALHLPESFPELQEVTNKEEDLDFWSNVCHVQLHRRARAFERIRRAGSFHPKLVDHYLLVLIEKAVDDDDGKGGVSASVTDAAVGCLGGFNLDEKALLRVLERFVVSSSSSTTNQKAYLRAISVLLENCRVSIRFMDFCSSKLIPFLRSNLEDRKKECIRAPVAVSMVKLLKRLPEEIMRDELPKILQVVCNLLRARLQRIRDDARAVLVMLSTELGDRYLMYVLHVLKTSLPMRGFTAHVLGYTTFWILEGLNAGENLRIIDDGLVSVILSIVEGDLFSDVAEAKEAAEFASSYKECKRCKSFDIIRMLGRSLQREEDLIHILSWVRDMRETSLDPKTRNKIAGCLSALRKGLGSRYSSSKSTPSAINIANLVSGIAQQQQQGDDQLLEFALGVANEAMNKGSEVSIDLSIRPIAVQAILHSKRSGCVVEALRLLKRCTGDVPYSLIVKAALRSPPDSPVGRETLSLLTHGILSKKMHQIDPRLMGRVVQWAGVSSTDSYRLHKALIKSRQILPEVYDSMEEIASNLVKSTDKTTRQLASSTMLAFLLDYPLGKKRLDHHVEFLLSNLGYEHSEGGRAEVCDILSHVARKFPTEILMRFFDKFVFFAFARAVNEESREVRKRVVEFLVDGLGSRNRSEMYSKYMRGFLDVDGSAGTVFLILERSDGECFDEFWKESKDRVIELLFGRGFNGSSIKACEDPIMIHKGLKMLEKHAVIMDQSTRGLIFEEAKALLLYPHEWVRAAASRLVYAIEEDSLLGKLEWQVFLKVLEEREISEELAKATLRNLLRVSSMLSSEELGSMFQELCRHRCNPSWRLKFIGMAFSGGGNQFVKSIPVDVAMRAVLRAEGSDDSELATEVFNSIVTKVGTDAGLKGYNAARERREGLRRERKQRRGRQNFR